MYIMRVGIYTITANGGKKSTVLTLCALRWVCLPGCFSAFGYPCYTRFIVSLYLTEGKNRDMTPPGDKSNEYPYRGVRVSLTKKTRQGSFLRFIDTRQVKGIDFWIKYSL